MTRSAPKSRSRQRSGAAAKVGTDPLPEFVEPCLATLAASPPEGETWAHEIKYDGYRIEARIEDGSVKLLTRSGLDWTVRFGAVAKALAGLRVSSALIDGEVVVETPEGVTSFTALVEALEAGRSEAMVLMAFDLLHLNGVDVRPAALSERKGLLKSLLDGGRKSPRVRFSEHLERDGAAVLKEACGLGLEGIISKRLDLPYRSGRRGDWVKSKCTATDEFVIGGYTVSTVDARSVGALALGYYDRGKLVYAGRVGTGFTRASAAKLWKALQPLVSDKPPFAGALTSAQRRGVVWLRPERVAQIEYRSWTGDGVLRHAAFKGLREDKAAARVKRPDTLSP